MNETRRIAATPRVTSDFYRGCLAHHQLTREGATGVLWEQQELALASLAIFGGVVCQVGCGDGKGLISMLGPLMRKSRRPLILIPGKLRSTFARELAKFKALGFAIPSHFEVKAHDFISRHSTWLDEHRPDFVFVDEAHAFRHLRSARTRRLLRYLDANPTVPNGGKVVFGVGSGTLTASSLFDVAHLLHHALGPNSPLPMLKSHGQISAELNTWAQVLDVDGRPSALDWHQYRPIVEAFAPELLFQYERAGGKTRRGIAREAYDRRSRCTPGLIKTDSESVPCSLVVYTHDEPKPPPNVRHALAQVAAGIRPDGEELFADDAAQWRAGQQLSIGVYYRWAWERVGGRDEEWIDARKEWARLVRRELEHRAAPNYDSPGLVAKAVEADIAQARETSVSHLGSAYVAWRRVADRYNVNDLREHVWLSDWFVRHVVEQARACNRPAIVWYYTQAAEDALRACGLPCYGAGSDPPSVAETCAVSWRRHGEGANLQELFADMYYLEFPSSGVQAEQSLARLHRNGQLADEVVAHVYTHTGPFRRNLRSARAKAEFLTKTQGRQRLSFVPIVAV
jgi:hypothetical protein